MNYHTASGPFISLVIACLILPSSALASPLYRWQDRQGVTHYSSTPPSKDAKPVELAPIMRGDPKYSQTKLVSCEQHGGVNCPAGADEDGSVICLDGFKAASLRFRFSCSVPKLSVNDITAIKEDGTFSVMIRNTKSVDAKGVVVTYQASSDKKLTLEGPQEIGPFGAAEYQFLPTPGSTEKTAAGLKLAMSNVEISCSNCP